MGHSSRGSIGSINLLFYKLPNIYDIKNWKLSLNLIDKIAILPIPQATLSILRP
jgi:hypothetical protein